MENYLIIGIMVLMVSIAVKYSVKHFKGQGGCCGGGTYKARRKKLSHVILRKTFTVEGMKCENCKSRVEEAVNDIDGASGRVDLKRGILTVSYEKEVRDDVIKAKVERLGYKVF